MRTSLARPFYRCGPGTRGQELKVLSNFSQPLSSTYLSPSLSLPAFLSHTLSLFRRTPTGGKDPTTPAGVPCHRGGTYMPPIIFDG